MREVSCSFSEQAKSVRILLLRTQTEDFQPCVQKERELSTNVAKCTEAEFMRIPK